MSLDIKLSFFILFFTALIIITSFMGGNDLPLELRIRTLKDAALSSGFLPSHKVNQSYDEAKSKLGQKLFKSEKLSLNGDTSCRTCHLETFGSADGLPNSIGVNGHGEGLERLYSDGQIVPRNSLPLWGRGGNGFDVFFWDGKVEQKNDIVLSQFGKDMYDEDPLFVAVHLPIVEIRELINDNHETEVLYQRESVATAEAIFELVSNRIQNDVEFTSEINQLYPENGEIKGFDRIADALTHFIKDEFKVRPSRFELFIEGKASLSETEIEGGLIFYGKARCSSCHNGPYFSDFSFHVIPIVQTGFGKNGFGIDYGRFNVSFNPDDLYQFRTPPLLNIGLTSPYSHSGTYSSIEDIVLSHVDPLAIIDTTELNSAERTEVYNRIRYWLQTYPEHAHLTEEDLKRLISFLNTLNFCEKGDDESGYCP